MNIIIATPCAGGVTNHGYTMSLITEALLHPDRLSQYKHYNIMLDLVKGYSGLAKDRSVIASRAMFHRVDKVVFIDNDQAWTWKQLKTILDSKKPIIAGVVPLKRYPMPLNFTPMVKDRECFKDEDSGSVHVANFERLRKKYSGQDEIEVQACGTGFLCIDTKVFIEMTKSPSVKPFYFPDTITGMDYAFDFFQTGVIDGFENLREWGERPPKSTVKIPGTDIEKGVGVYFGEDWGFCQVARQCGFQIHINSNVLIPHEGIHKFEIGNEVIKRSGYDSIESRIQKKRATEASFHPESFS